MNTPFRDGGGLPIPGLQVSAAPAPSRHHVDDGIAAFEALRRRRPMSKPSSAAVGGWTATARRILSFVATGSGRAVKGAHDFRGGKVPSAG